MSYAVETHRLTKHYGKKRVVDALNLRVETGSVYALLGRNGAGKSTSIKMITGMVRPDCGEARLLGESVAALSPETRARICYLAEAHPLYGWMTIGEATRFARAFYPTWNHSLHEQILDHFELSRRQRIRSLSRGQLAQVSLALGVAPEPELLILDDPTLGLDTVVRRDFLESLIQIIHREGRTILLSSHMLGDVERVADRVGVMIGGVLRVDCPTDHFRQNVKRVIADFHGVPPEAPPCQGLVNWRNVGSALELILIGYDADQRAVVESLQPRDIQVVDLNLEDAFIEYTRGKKRSLPVFASAPPPAPKTPNSENPNVPSPSDQGAA